jgi:leucyl-tRNA synthetase
MADRYDPADIEAKWQAYWDEHGTFRTPPLPDGPKSYVLDMFPYPSGAGLHVGHPEGYTATDIVARYRRARGRSVLHPMGWDAFGLPAEQHALKTGTHPRATTVENIQTFKRQLKMLGFSYDWDREVDTTDPKYVRWTQWIFLQLFKRGLAYQDEIAVNWCAELGTVLANEEVQDGRSEIGDHPVERVPLRQWMLKITAYADRLLSDLEQTDWPDSTRTMQREWIGRSEGAEIQFAVDGVEDAFIQVFTTRPDTLYGATFLVLAPEHPLVARITGETERDAVERYVTQAKNKSDLERKTAKDKTGVFTGAHAVHPMSGERVPIWIADYVLTGYGTGAIMAVPAHDERDFEFAKERGLTILEVVSPTGEPTPGGLAHAYVDEGYAVHSGPYDGMPTQELKSQITTDLETQGKGRRRVEYRLRDWVFSRQRYWGEPIPIYFPVETDGDPRKGDPHTIRYDQPMPVDEAELPVLIPDLEDFKPGADPAGPLARAVDWRFFQRNGQWFARETNTMPQWAGSCWYYLRFLDPHNEAEPFSKEKADAWLPVDLYVGGAEHAVLHLLYARFWHKVLYDAGLVSCPEPFAKLVHQGMILGEVEYTKFLDPDGQSVSRSVVDTKRSPPIHKETGAELRVERVPEASVTKNKAGEYVLAEEPELALDARAHKMSKSRGNVVNPDTIVREFGADAMRVYEMFMGPLEATKPWSTSGIQGVKRFLDRVWDVAGRVSGKAEPDEALTRSLHQTIRKVTEDIEQLRLNTAVSQMMVLTNELMKRDPVPLRAVATLAQLLHPFAPHLAEEVWSTLGHAPSIQAVPWPEYDPALCEETEVEIPVQVNGKLRGRIRLPKDAAEDQAVAAAKADPKVAAHLEGKELKKTVWVPSKILNFIAK